MAACTFAVGTADTGTSANTSGNFSPASGDLLICFVGASATVDAAPTLSSSIGGFTFSLITSRQTNGALHCCYAYVSDALVSNTAAQSVTWTHSTDQSTGTNIMVYRVSGMTKTGLTAIRQFESQTFLAAGTPSDSFALSCITTNPTLCVATNVSNPANITPNGSWTEPTGGDIGYTNPDYGTAVCHRDSGFTGTTITWGATSATAGGLIMLELDASANSLISAFPKRLPLVGVA